MLGLLGFHGTFWLYSGVGLVMAGYGWWTIPDNRGLSLVCLAILVLSEMAIFITGENRRTDAEEERSGGGLSTVGCFSRI